MATVDIDKIIRVAGGSNFNATEQSFLVLGKTPSLVPEIDCGVDSSGSYAGIVLASKIEPAELARILESAHDPAVPIADFAGNYGLRVDHVGNKFEPLTNAELRHTFAPILRRLEAIPFHCGLEDRPDMTILRLAYSRNAPITAVFDSVSPNVVEYPLLGRSSALRHRLEALSNLQLLHRRHFIRTHQCGRCNSARLNVYEACPACHSADLFETSIVHHYRCGWQEPEPRFVKDHLLVCPKCHDELRHYGVDYDKPGSVVVCRNCHQANSEPDVHFVCLDCAHVTPITEAQTVDWHHYDLTDVGLQALRDGRIPRFEIGDYIDKYPRAFALRDFRLLANESIHIARRHGRPFSIGMLSITNTNSLRSDRGPVVADDVVRRAVDIIIESLSESDFVAVGDSHSIFIGLPEINQKEAQAALDELCVEINAAVGLSIARTAGVAEGNGAGQMLPSSDDR